MYARKFMFLIGVVFVYSQVFPAEYIYVAELMVESNATLETEVVLSALELKKDLSVKDNDGVSHQVTLTHIELIADCLLIGEDVSCNCSAGYMWSNDVCYNYSCCRDTTCRQKVIDILPLCIAKVKVQINGSVTLLDTTWDSKKTTELKTEFEQLNGFEYLNITGQRQSNSIADFEAAVSVKFETSKLQAIMNELERKLQAVLQVDTIGMVTMDAPETEACYLSTQFLKCTFEEETSSSGWNISRNNKRTELYLGSVVQLDNSCSTQEYKSCTAVTLKGVTSIWAGIYECGFSAGAVRHTAKGNIHVVPLPDEILLKPSPLTVECSGKAEEPVYVTATILKSTENFKVSCDNPAGCEMISNTTDESHHIYTFKAPINCDKVSDRNFAKVTFENSKKQRKNATVDIPVIYAGTRFCSEEVLNGELWPKTPYADTVINRTCPEGRTGFKSRTCDGPNWQSVFSSCVKEELHNILLEADGFSKGLGATQEVAMVIFEGLKNSSTDFGSDSSDSTADISTSIGVLGIMANASGNVELQEDVFGDFVDAASNMLNNSWSGVNDSVVHSMSSTYLESVEMLVKNINVNTSTGLKSPNLDLNFCREKDCEVTVFDINLNLSKTDGVMKTVAVKKLMEKLKNNFDDTERLSLLVSATLQNNNDSSIKIRMDFPAPSNLSSHMCVFWNTTHDKWSKEGCSFKKRTGNRTLCVCDHLTSFSILMAKGDVSNKVLDIITSVGLGISVCCLLIFLIIESIVWSAVVKTNLSHFRHTALVNIAVFLLLGDICFLASSSPKSLSETWCEVLTICKHLFFLAMFSWMLCMSVMLVHQLIFVFSPLRKRLFMFLSGIVGYFCPVVIVGSSYVFYKYTKKSYFDKKTCWLHFDRLLEGSIHAFLIPVGTVILINIFSMVVVIATLVKSSTPDGSKVEDKETVKSIVKVIVFLTPIFGVTWIIGFAMFMLKEDHPMFDVANYSFTILNSFQGFFLLLTGCFAEQKVREELFKRIMAKSNGTSESMKNLTSNTYTKEK